MTILVDMPLQEEHKKTLTLAAGSDEIFFCENDEAPEDIVRRADVIIGCPALSLLEKAGSLRFLQIHSAGTGQYLKLRGIRPGARLACASGCYGTAISEHMIGVLLEMMKKLTLYRDQQASGAWTKRGFVDAIEGAKVLVVGLGDIGGTFAKKMNALGAEVTGVNRHGGEAQPYVKALYPISRLDCLLPEADIVAMSMPETPETVGMMNRDRFALMKPGAYLVNVGRGSAVDQDALLDALRSGRLAGAALDVTSPEPLPADHPLWREPRCVITPHISGGFALPLTLKKIVALAARNIEAFRTGAPIASEVDFDTGYRALR